MNERVALPPLGMVGGNCNIVDLEKFNDGVKLIIQSLRFEGATIFCSDNIITWHKNYSFLRDPFFIHRFRSFINPTFRIQGFK
jgi:hypothetical protein